MKFWVLVSFWTIFGVYSAEEESPAWDAWLSDQRGVRVGPLPIGGVQPLGAGPQPVHQQMGSVHNQLGAVPQPIGAAQYSMDAVQQPMGAVPWWSKVNQGGAGIHTQSRLPVAKQPPGQFRMPSQQIPLVQKRTTLTTPSDQQPTTNPAGVWTSNTGQGVNALQAQLNRLFQSPGGVTGWGNPDVELFVPVENLMNALAELTKLIRVVVTFCEEERNPKGAYSSADKFPADTFLSQGARYAKRVTSHFRALRDLLGTVSTPSVSKKAVDQAIERFRAKTADAKEVFLVGCQVADAAVGAVLPYISTCSFFPKGDTNGNYRLWSYVGARISSTLRYLYHVTTDLHAVAGKFKYLVSGKIEPQSVGDLARSRVLFRAVNNLETAEARSISAVRYFNELAAAYYKHIGSSSDAGQPQVIEARPTIQQVVGDGVNNDFGELSLLLDDLGADNLVHADDDPESALQTAEDADDA